MVGLEERDVLLASLKGYLDELRESGVEELPFGAETASAATDAPLVAAGATAPVAAPNGGGVSTLSPGAAPARGTGTSGASPLPAAPTAANAGAMPAPATPAPGPAPAAASPGAEATAPAAAASIDAIGNPQARLAFVIAGGGFEGASGTLLAKIVVAMGFAPEQVLLLSLHREVSRPDEDLRKVVFSKITEVAPEAVVALGEKAAQLLLDSGDAIARLRGRFVKVAGVPVMATLHPDQLLADETLKREVWNEMKKVMALLASA